MVSERYWSGQPGVLQGDGGVKGFGKLRCDISPGPVLGGQVMPNHRGAVHIMVSRLVLLATGTAPSSKSDDGTQHHLLQ
jgi:hypothetical protein